MNLELVDKLARSLLYEGYILYPYRASAVKNRQRFNFGGVYPPAFSEAQKGTDACLMQTECLVEAQESAKVNVRVRFLHLRTRRIGRLNKPSSDSTDLDHLTDMEYQFVESLHVDDRSYHTWQEAVERDVVIPSLDPAELIKQPYLQPIRFEATREIEPLSNSAGETVAVAIRQQQLLLGAVEISAEQIEPSLLKIRVVISNQTPLEEGLLTIRDEALVRSLISTHTVLEVTGGAFVSLLDPPEEKRAAAAGCQNVGTWPVLVGAANERDMLLSSPIILYDYPQLAPESPGELYDGTEIDEILTLRIMTLTDDEKQEMRSVDERARAILERTEQMPQEQLMKMHGAMRGLLPVERTTP